jgi:glycosyltransferase involved in cell wall biosynthesis
VAERPITWLHSHFLLPTGGTKFIFEVARRLARRHPVEMLVERTSPHWREEYEKAGVPLREIGGPTSTSMAYWLALPVFVRRDRRAAVAAAPGSAALVSSFFPMNWAAAVAASRADIRHVHLCFEPFPFFHDREVIGMYPVWKRALLAYLRVSYRGLDARAVRRADRLLTLNEATAMAIERVYGVTGAEPTYAGVDTEFFRPYSEAELTDLRARHGDGPIVIHSTDYSPIKRTDLALRAFAAAGSPNGAAPRLLVTSTREDARSQRELAELARSLSVADRVEFLGFLSYEDLPRYYSLADVLLQTGTAAGSGATTMSLPVKEALACGTPVVRSEATDEDVVDGVSGYLVNPLDVEATGARISMLLADRERARDMGEAGRRRIVELYDWDRVTDIVLRAALG